VISSWIGFLMPATDRNGGPLFVGTGRLLRMASGSNHRLPADERLGPWRAV
jgi:hypothetical protein